jgi:hypothetical protein
MAHVTRRGFIQSASIGGAAIALASVPGLAASIDTADAQSLGHHATFRGPLVAYVGDPSKDEISLMVGTRKVVIRNRKLVAQLTRAAR